MISLAAGSAWFTLRTAAVVLDEGHVLLHHAEGDSVWALPGGRVEAMESAAAALVREMREELGTEAQVGRLLWFVENFYAPPGRPPQHEVGTYFETTFAPQSTLYDKTRTHLGADVGPAGAVTLHFRWFPIGELAGVSLFPTFLRTGLQAPPSVTQHVVHVDTSATDAAAAP